MRIERLDLLAYGPFREKSLELGPGLHLLYGPNEAGKSTTLRALSSLLFGYPDRRQDDWVVSTADMALGARIRSREGRILEFVRRRRGKLPLVHLDGTPLPEEVLSSFLGGLTKITFEHLFSLDHERLRTHGQELLEEGGALGAGLVEAGSGIRDLRRKLDGLTKMRRDLFLPSGSLPPINRILKRLQEIRREVRTRVVSPQEYWKEEEEIRRLSGEERTIGEKRQEVEREGRRVERILRILPRRQELLALEETLSRMEATPLLPPDFTSLRIQAETESEQAREELERVLEDSRALEEEIRQVRVPEVSGDLPEEELKALEEEIGAVDKSLSDFPRRERELQEMENEARTLLSQAGFPDDPLRIGEFLVTPAKRRRMEMLLENRTRQGGARTEAVKALEKAKSALERAFSEQNRLEPVPETGLLEEVLSRLEHQVAQEADRRRQKREIERRKQTLLENMRSLGIGEIDLPALRSMVLPEEQTVRNYKEFFRALLEEERRIFERLRQLEEDRDARTIRKSELERAGEIVTPEDLKELRRKRDESWSLLRRHLLEGDAGVREAFVAFFGRDPLPQETFERLLRQADVMSDRLRERSEEAVELALLRQTLETMMKEIGGAEDRLVQIRSDIETRTLQWIALWPPDLVRKDSAGRPDRYPDAMLEWLEKYTRILSDGEKLESDESALSAALEAEEKTIAKMVDVLSGDDPKLRRELLQCDSLTLLSHARSAVEKARANRRKHDQVQKELELTQKQREEAEMALREIETDLSDWMKSYKNAESDWKVPLPDDPEETRDLLQTLARLEELSRSMENMRGRVEAMKEDHRRFEDKVSSLFQAFHCPPVAGGVLEKARAFVRYLRQLREDRILRKELEKRREDIENRKKRLEDALERNLRLLEHLFSEANVRDLEELSRIEQQSREKTACLSRREELLRLIREEGEGESLDALLEACRDQSPDDLNVRLKRLKEEGEALRKDRDSLLGVLATKKADLDRKLEEAQAVDLQQEAEVEKAKLSGLVEQYVNITVMEEILRRGTELYRERNQGPVLNRARTLLQTLTGGKYRNLRADLGEKNEVLLLVEREDGRSLEVGALSDGTLDALYLALRLAAILRHNETGEPIPFVADDLLLNLDNERAGQAFVALSEVARRNQVLFFTHHAHMMELARQCVPEDILVCHGI